MKFFKQALAEAYGTFALTFLGAGAVMANEISGGELGLLGIALANGLAVALAVASTINVSGGYINPAITLGFLVAGKLKSDHASMLVLGQLAGAVAGGGLLMALTPPEAFNAAMAGTPMLGEEIPPMTGLALEMVATFFLAVAVWGTVFVAKASGALAGLAIGLMVTALILVFGPFTGAAMNPARYIGSAIFAGEWSLMHVYWLGPILGASVGFLFAGFVLKPTRNAA